MDIYLKFDYVIGLETKCKIKNELILSSLPNNSGIEYKSIVRDPTEYTKIS